MSVSIDDTIYWPSNLNRPLTHKFNLTGSTITPGQTGSGSFPFARFDGGGLWLGTLNQCYLANDDAVRCWEAIRMMAQGGVMPIAVPVKPVRLAPWPPATLPGLVALSGVDEVHYPDQPFSDGSRFSDGSGFHQPAISASTLQGAAARASRLDINFVSGGPPRGGEFFAINHPTQGWRLYQIKSVMVYAGSSDVGAVFEPPLRDVVNPGTPIEFDMPRCTMRLDKPDAMDLELSTYPYPRPNASFVELLF